MHFELLSSRVLRRRRRRLFSTTTLVLPCTSLATLCSFESQQRVSVRCSSLCPLKHFFDPLQSPRALADAECFQERDVELGVDAAAEVSTNRRNATFPFEQAQIVRRNPKTPGGLRYADHTIHRRPRYTGEL